MSAELDPTLPPPAAAATRTVLLVDHTAALGGAELALAALVGELDRGRYAPRALLLEDGPLVARLRAAGTATAVLAVPSSLAGVARDAAAASPAALLRNAWASALVVPRLVRAIRGARPDLVVANSLKSAVLVSLAAPLAGRPWAWHLHDRLADDYLPRPVMRALRLLARLGPRVVVVNSAATLATVPGARAVVAHPGVRTAGRPVRDGAAGRADVRFGLLGRIAPTKGQREFLMAAGILGAARPDARFAVLGEALFNDAGYAEEVRALPARLGLAGRVEFTGWLDDPATELAGLDVLVHASPVPEPFGQVLVEAMLAGVPVIATDAGGAVEILGGEAPGEALAPGVRRTSSGLLVAPGDPDALAAAMRFLHDDPAGRDLLAAAARERARERFDLAVTTRDVERAWDAALTSRSDPRRVARHR